VSAHVCPCWSAAVRCDPCHTLSLYHLTGTAEARGINWANRLRIKAPGQPWVETPRMLIVARRQIADLAGSDERLAEALTRACVDAAKRAYTAD
jgi:hypothetical protein